jgi:hypothetical protein
MLMAPLVISFIDSVILTYKICFGFAKTLPEKMRLQVKIFPKMKVP